MNLKILRLLVAVSLVLIVPATSSGHELKTRYASLIYDNDDTLRRFNKEIYLGSLSYLLRNRKSLTAEDDVKNKFEVIVEKVESILEMYPKEVGFTVWLLPSEDEVHDFYKTRYGKSADYVAFYSSREKMMFVSVRDVDVSILAHEIAHAIIDSYYGTRTPSRIHEVLAEYVVDHLRD